MPLKQTYGYPTITQAFDLLDDETSAHNQRYVEDRWDLQRIEDALVELSHDYLAALCKGQVRHPVQQVLAASDDLQYANDFLDRYIEVGETPGANGPEPATGPWVEIKPDGLRPADGANVVIWADEGRRIEIIKFWSTWPCEVMVSVHPAYFAVIQRPKECRMSEQNQSGPAMSKSTNDKQTAESRLKIMEQLQHCIVGWGWAIEIPTAPKIGTSDANMIWVDPAHVIAVKREAVGISDGRLVYRFELSLDSGEIIKFNCKGPLDDE